VRVGVAFLTCDRLEYSRRTLESFTAHNPDARERLILVHADDASEKPAHVAELAAAHGFKTLVQHTVRRGVRGLRAAAVAKLAELGAEWILVLENDWEWTRPIPWDVLECVMTRHDIYTLRLYGQYKGRGRTWPCWNFHRGRDRSPVVWKPLEGAPERVEVGSIHWGAPPSITRTRELLELCIRPSGGGYDGTGDLHEMHASAKLRGRLVARVVENVVFHIGDEPTAPPGGRAPVVVKAPPRPAVKAAPAPPRYSEAWQKLRSWTRPGSTRCLDEALASWKPRTLLDVGCGDGHLVERARRTYGIDAVGVDLSIPADASGPLHHADLREPLALGRRFGMVLCWEVAEHLPPAAADVLCQSLVDHLAPGGVLLFTAARPRQGGDGHINEQDPEYWRSRLVARGLAFDHEQSGALAGRWKKAAPGTPWYGRNLQIFRAPGQAAGAEAGPRIAITMRTADRSPNPNYVGGTIRRLLAQGIDAASIHLCVTAPGTDWLDEQLAGLAPVTRHVPIARRTPNKNGLEQIRCLELDAYDWVLLLEDDLAFCADFVGSLGRWLTVAGRADRNVYRLFGFRLAPPTGRAAAVAYDFPLKGLCGSQAVVFRREDARAFLAWADANIETWGGFRGNAAIAFDKLIAAWALGKWPTRPGVVSHPLFVQHVGDVSSLHPRAARNDSLFAGYRWRFPAREVLV